MRLFFHQLAQGADPLVEINKFFDERLRAIQDTLDRLAEALEEQQA
jgi:hypothetical protein